MKILELSKSRIYWITGNKKFRYYEAENVYCFINKMGIKKLNCLNNKRIEFKFNCYAEFEKAREIFIRNGYKNQYLYTPHNGKEKLYDPNSFNLNPDTIKLHTRVIIPKNTNKKLLGLMEDLYKNGYRTSWIIPNCRKFLLIL